MINETNKLLDVNVQFASKQKSIFVFVDMKAVGECAAVHNWIRMQKCAIFEIEEKPKHDTIMLEICASNVININFFARLKSASQIVCN